jgi:outer membrane lipoprotein-sorting protein
MDAVLRGLAALMLVSAGVGSTPPEGERHGGPGIALAPCPVDSSGPTTGREVMEEAERRRRTDSMYSEGFVIVESKKRVRKKAWRSWRSGWGASARSLLQFVEPAEVKGVGLLTIAHPDRPDEQWLYTPAIDRDRRIARQEKATRFIGTHFTYEDMEERDVDDYDYELLDEAAADGTLCYRVRANPRARKESQYSRLDFWVVKEQFVTVRMETYVDGALRRTFRASDVRPVEGIQTAHRWEVVDEKRGGRTLLELRNVTYRAGGEEGIFTLQGMRVLRAPPPPDPANP